MKRVLLVIAGLALLGAVLPVSVSGAGTAAGSPGVNVVHGIGPGANAVDTYIRAAADTDWTLLQEDFQYLDTDNIGVVDPGDYNVLICTHVAAPNETITSCGDNAAQAVNGNSGTDVTVPASGSAVLVAAFSDPNGPLQGRPTVLAFEPDLDCVDDADTARVTAAHAASAGAVDVFVDDAEAFSDVTNGSAGTTDVPTGDYDVRVDTVGGDPVIPTTGVNLPGAENNFLIVVGNGDPQFDVASVFYQLELCEQPTTTTTIETTTTAPEPAPSAQPQQVTPAFTG